MAQLIKLQDYVSRYENDLSRYPSQYVRLKKQQWDKILAAWKAGESPVAEDIPFGPIDADSEKQSLIGRMKGFFKKENAGELEYETPQPSEKKDDAGFEISYPALLGAGSEDELKQIFLDQLFRFQLNWASSTIAEKSIVDSKYNRSERLKHFLQRFPDSYFLLYEPIFLLKKAPVEAEVLLLTPTDIWCLTFIEEEQNAAYTGSTERFWIKRSKGSEKKILNPGLSASRIEKIVKQLFKLYEVELPVRKAVISRNGYLDYPDAPADLLLLDKRSYGAWFDRMRASGSPLKMMQIRAATALLDYCQTTSFSRLYWNQENE